MGRLRNRIIISFNNHKISAWLNWQQNHSFRKFLSIRRNVIQLRLLFHTITKPKCCLRENLIQLSTHLLMKLTRCVKGNKGEISICLKILPKNIKQTNI